MSHVTSAEYTLDNPTHSYEGHMRRLASAQVHATLAVAEAQNTANLIAFLEWADEQPDDTVTKQEWLDAIEQVKERIK